MLGKAQARKVFFGSGVDALPQSGGSIVAPSSCHADRHILISTTALPKIIIENDEALQRRRTARTDYGV